MYNVSGLTNYIEVNKEVILKDAILGSGLKGETIPMLRKQLGVKTSERLNYLDVTPTIQPVTGCGFSAQGDTVFSERDIVTAQAKVNDEWCAEQLLNKFAEYKVRIGANEQEMPFEAEITDQIVKGVQKDIERQIWVGDKSNGDLVDGFVTIALGADSASTITGATAQGATAYEAIRQAYMLIPEEWIDKATIFCSAGIFREYIQNLVDANLYHYDPAFSGELTEMYLAGSDVKVRKCFGLANDNHIYVSATDNMVYGTDFENNKEEVDAWYSKDDDVYRLKMRFNFGVNTLYPDAVVVVEKN